MRKTIFDTLRYIKALKAVNVPEKQAEAQAEALRDVLDTTLFEQAAQLVTKGDIALLESKIALARRDTIIWLGGMLIAGFGTVIGMLKFG